VRENLGGHLRAFVATGVDDGVIHLWSKGCEQLYGWTAAEATGQVMFELQRTRP
jgi:hypothetical protein